MTVERRSAVRDSQVDAPPWEVVARRRESWLSRVRRWAVVSAAGVVMVTGAVTIAGQVARWVAPVASPSVPSVSDGQLAGAATVAATDYLSWDQADRVARQAALARVAAPGVVIDGWDGSGRQWADSPAVIGFARAGDRALVTVRVRVVPFRTAGGPVSPAGDPLPAGTVSPSVSATPTVGPNVAAAPELVAPGWVAQPARWLTVAVAVARRGGRIVVTAPPALVGSPPVSVAPPAVSGGSGAGDAQFAAATKEAVARLLTAYGTGDLEFVRAAGTGFAGLDQAAELESVTGWRVARVAQGADPGRRVGDVTVSWALAGDAGRLSCSYRVELLRRDDRWYLAAVSPVIDEVS